MRIDLSEPERSIFRPRERLSVSEWAAAYRIVVRGPAQGKWRNELTPYCIEPMCTIALPWVRKIFLCWAPQSGKTSVGFNFLLYALDQDPGPVMMIMPDEKSAKRMARRQLIPTLRATPQTAALLSERADEVSRLHIVFKNGADILLAWASSAAALASESIRYIFWDEPGKYPEFAGAEADPFSLGDVRTNAFPYTSKQLFYSTPAIEGDAFDRLIKSEAEEVRRYHARCPICGALQLMDFERIHWGGKRDHREVLRHKLARYTCGNCGMDWDDRTRDIAVRDGCWKAETPVERATAVAFGPLESWYSPFISLSKAAADFLKSKEDPQKLQAWVTQHSARPWADRVSNQSETAILEHRTALEPGIVPAWALALTAGFDVQKRGVWFVVRAWGEDLTSQLVLYGHLPGFAEVEALVYHTEFPVEGCARKMQIWRAALDTGGNESAESNELSATEAAYEFLYHLRRRYGARDVGGRGLYGVKGSSRRMLARVSEEKFLDPRPAELSKAIKYRAMIGLRLVDSFEMKGLIHWRINERQGERKDAEGNVIPADSNRFLLHAETGMDYVRQLLAEQLVKDRRGKREWKRIRSDNHLLDCEVYAAACVENSWQPSFRLLAPNTKAALQLVGEQGRKPQPPPGAAPAQPEAPRLPQGGRPGGLPDNPVGYRSPEGNSWLGGRTGGWFRR